MWRAAASLEQARDEGAAAVCAEAVGAMRKVLADTVEYCKQRQQFGQPIGGFQVLQHRMVDMYMELEQAVSAAYLAVLNLDAEPATRARAVSAAKATVGRAARLIITHNHPDHFGLAQWFVERHGAELHHRQHFLPADAGAVEGHDLGAVAPATQARQLARPEGQLVAGELVQRRQAAHHAQLHRRCGRCLGGAGRLGQRGGGQPDQPDQPGQRYGEDQQGVATDAPWRQPVSDPQGLPKMAHFLARIYECCRRS